ncbi:MAG TPA: endolytic transglycosylase MltG [Aquimonas sp.]|nr:endolytic transglycosylase MltG [Aquimonas sp.]HRF52940.1 endolytic transglycosylase MltG [Aquimonas sp.]
MRRLLRFLLGLGLLTLVLVSAGGILVWRDYQRFVQTPLSSLNTALELELPKGASFLRSLSVLREAGIREGHDLYWRFLARDMGVQSRLKAGEYRLAANLTPRTVLQQLAEGRVIQRKFTVIEGWNFRELRVALAGLDAVEHTLGDASEAEIMQKLGREGLSAEGRFLPETYLYTRNTTDIALLSRAMQAMDQQLAEAWLGRDPDLPLHTADEALILASIIEKETGQSGERAEIAGVFVRRLRIGMRLQTDPTVIYGVGERFDGNLTRAHLQADTPWNTYTRAGLPPTPIAMPGRAALMAAVHPAQGKSLYFVARGDGSHVFSDTLSEHNRAVRQYQLRQR